MEIGTEISRKIRVREKQPGRSLSARLREAGLANGPGAGLPPASPQARGAGLRRAPHRPACFPRREGAGRTPSRAGVGRSSRQRAAFGLGAPREGHDQESRSCGTRSQGPAVPQRPGRLSARAPQRPGAARVRDRDRGLPGRGSSSGRRLRSEPPVLPGLLLLSSHRLKILAGFFFSSG